MVTYPEDWTQMQLKDLGYIQMCRRIFQSQTKAYGDIPFYKISTFGGKADAYISQELYEQYKSLYPYPEKGDVLISAAGTVGKTVIFDGRDSYFQDSNIVWLKVDKNAIDRRFLWWFYRSYPWEALEGTTIQRLYNSIILKTEIHLPDKPEQEDIARTLSQFDTYIDDLAELIEKNRGIRDGALEDMMSGRTRLQGFTADWVVYPFSKYFSLLPTNTCSRDQLSDRGQVGDIHYGDVLIKYGDVLSDADEIPRLKDASRIKERSFLQIHDVLIADTAEDETVGKVVQVGKVSIPLVGGLHTVACRPNYETAEGFLGYYMNSSQYHEQLYQYITGIKVSSVSKKSFGETELCIPAEVEEQKAIVSVLKAMDEEIEALEIERDKMIQIREGAMDDLLTGCVRLKGTVV